MTLADALRPRHIGEFAVARLREAVGGSEFLQRVYCGLEFVLGWLELKRGRFFRAGEHFCKASRRVQVHTIARDRARVHLRRYFAKEGVAGTLDDFLRTPRARALRARFLPQPFPQNVTFRGNLLPLKAYDSATGERGVLILKYNYLFEAFHALYHTEELKEFYRIVLEPSFHHYEDPGYTLYRGWEVVLQAGNTVLRSSLESIGTGFETVPLTSSDWTDSDVFCPHPDLPKVYDLIYVANWSRNKRHELLFRTMAKLDRPLRVALVGFTWERSREALVEEMNKYGVAGRCQIFQGIPAAEVNKLFNLSRVNLMLSRQEGGNKALNEAMFADVPSIVYRHCRGLDLACVNEQTGVLVEDEELGDAISQMVEHSRQFSPRAWALKHTGYLNSSRLLNEKVRDVSLVRGESWARDIAPKANSPDPVYKSDEDAERLRPVLGHLEKFLRLNQI